MRRSDLRGNVRRLAMSKPMSPRRFKKWRFGYAGRAILARLARLCSVEPKRPGVPGNLFLIEDVANPDEAEPPERHDDRPPPGGR